MDDALGVCCFERIRNLNCHSSESRFDGSDRPIAVLQRRAFHEFHRNKRLAVVFADFVDGANIRMIQGGSRLGFALEAAQSC